MGAQNWCPATLLARQAILEEQQFPSHLSDGDEDGTKKSLLKETMCNELPLVLSMQLHTAFFSLPRPSPHGHINVATGAATIDPGHMEV